MIFLWVKGKGDSQSQGKRKPTDTRPSLTHRGKGENIVGSIYVVMVSPIGEEAIFKF